MQDDTYSVSPGFHKVELSFIAYEMCGSTVKKSSFSSKITDLLLASVPNVSKKDDMTRLE